MSAGPVVDVAIVGAGLAGLAAASALARAGYAVTLLDRKPFVGGRAYSYPHPTLEEVVDSQHVLVGCCTNLRHLCAMAGVADRIRWYDGYTFLEPGGRRSALRSAGLPAPGHSSLSFLAAPMLEAADKVSIVRGLMEHMRGYPLDDAESVAHWLARTKQTERAVRHFWEPVVVGALNDTFDRCSMRYAGQVIYETFLKSAEGGRLGIPTLPLSEFYANVAKDAEAHGAAICLKAGVVSMEPDGGQWRLGLADGGALTVKAVILALPFDGLAGVLGPGLMREVVPEGLEAFRHSPITTIHLWFDREITDLDHAVLLDTTIQWIFHKSRIRGWAAERGSYVELTISASHAELRRSREEILTVALRELHGFFTETQRAVLRKSAVLKEAKATFSVTPGLDRFRPAQATPVEGLYLAGDWTRTGWPSTMEGAVRSGYLAAEAVTRQLGGTQTFMQAELPAAGLMRFLARRQP